MFECYESTVISLRSCWLSRFYQVWAQAVCGGRSKTVRSLREHTGKTGRLGRVENEENKNNSKIFLKIFEFFLTDTATCWKFPSGVAPRRSRWKGLCWDVEMPHTRGMNCLHEDRWGGCECHCHGQGQGHWSNVNSANNSRIVENKIPQNAHHSKCKFSIIIQ